MSVAKNILIGTLGIGAVAGGAYLYKLYKIGANLVVDQTLNFEITKRNFLGIPTELNMIVNVMLKNAENNSLSLTQPFVQLFLDDQDETPFASSTPSKKEFVLPPLGTLSFDPIHIPISLTTIFTLAPKVYLNVTGGKPIGITSKATTYIDGAIRITEKQRKEIKL